MRTSKMTAGALALALALSIAATEGEETPPTVDLSATAVATGSTIAVSGDVAFGGIQEAGTDASGDAEVPNIGTDFTRATLEQDGDVLLATVEIADGVPTVGGLPEGVQYGWDLTAGNSTYALSAWRSATRSGINTSDPGSSEITTGTPALSVQTCAPDPQTGQNTCASDPVEGEFTDTHIRWEIPFSKISAVPGVELAPAGVIHATPGAAGAIWFNPGAASLDEMPHYTFFTLGGEVTAELLDTAGEVVASKTATATGGAFDLSFAEVPAGDYIVEVSSIYADVEQVVEIPVTVADATA